jgi:MFS family permease
MSDPNRIGRNARDRRAWQPRSNKWLIAIVVTFAAFMEILDTTIVNVSLTHIAGAMSVSYDDATWSLTSYLVANGVVLTISGWLARVCGRKRYFLICVAMFAVASMLCGLAQNLTELILARTVQGFLAAGCSRRNKRYFSTLSVHRSAPEPSGSRPSPQLWRRRSDRRSEAGSLTITAGLGYSSSIFRLAH